MKSLKLKRGESGPSQYNDPDSPRLSSLTEFALGRFSQRAWLRVCGNGRLTYKLDVSGKPQQLKRADAPPVNVYLVPGQSVTRCGRVRVMVVVPAFAECQQRHPP